MFVRSREIEDKNSQSCKSPEGAKFKVHVLVVGMAEAEGQSLARSTSTPEVVFQRDSVVGDGYPPVMVLFHPSMEKLARKIVETASAIVEKRSLSRSKVVNIMLARLLICTSSASPAAQK